MFCHVLGCVYPVVIAPDASYLPVVSVLPAVVDGDRTALFVGQLPLFVHVGSSHQFDTQTETLVLGQTQSI